MCGWVYGAICETINTRQEALTTTMKEAVMNGVMSLETAATTVVLPNGSHAQTAPIVGASFV